MTNHSTNPGGATAAAGGAAPAPRLVIRGETPNKGSITPAESTSPDIALIDWLAFTIPAHEERDHYWLKEQLADVFAIPPESWHGTDRKWSGYRHRVDLMAPVDRGESIPIGLVAYGGETQRGTMHVSLNGEACDRLQDWTRIADWGHSIGAVITRADVAHDDFHARSVSVRKALAWYDSGGFTGKGRRPKAKLIDDLNSGTGKTLGVGNRVNGKYARIYEKGKQLGIPTLNWCRAEVEFRNKARVIPWDILIRPGQYLAGAYPCLEYLSETQERIRTSKVAAAISYERMVKWLKTAGGKALNVMLQVEGGDAESVLLQLVREGAPSRLRRYADQLPELIDGEINGHTQSQSSR